MYAVSSALEAKDDKECAAALANFCATCASLDDAVKAEIVACSPRILTTLLRMASGPPRKLPAGTTLEDDSGSSARGLPMSPSAPPADPLLPDLAVELLASLGEAGPVTSSTILSLPNAVPCLLRYLHGAGTDKGKQRAGLLLAHAPRSQAVDALFQSSLSQCSTTLAGISSSTAARANAVRCIRHLLATAGKARLLLADALLVELLVELFGGDGLGAPNAGASVGANTSVSAAQHAPTCSVFADEAMQALLAISRAAADTVMWDASGGHAPGGGDARGSPTSRAGQADGHGGEVASGADASGDGAHVHAKEQAPGSAPTAQEREEALAVLALLGSNADIFSKLVLELGKICCHSFVAASILQNLCYLEANAHVAIQAGAVEALHALMAPGHEGVDSLSPDCLGVRPANDDAAPTQAAMSASPAAPSPPREPLETSASGRQAAAVALACLLATDSYASSNPGPGRDGTNTGRDGVHAGRDAAGAAHARESSNGNHAAGYGGRDAMVGDAAVLLVANVRRVQGAMPFQPCARTQQLAAEAERLVGALGVLVTCDRTGEAALASGLLELCAGLLKDGRRRLTPRLQLLVARALLGMAFVPACRKAMIDAGSGGVLTKYLRSWVQQPAEPHVVDGPEHGDPKDGAQDATLEAEAGRAHPEAHLASQGALWLLSSRSWADLDTIARMPSVEQPASATMANGAHPHRSTSKGAVAAKGTQGVGSNPDIGELSVRLLGSQAVPSKDVRSPGTVSLTVRGEGDGTLDLDCSMACSDASKRQLSPGDVGTYLSPSSSDAVFFLFNTCAPTEHESHVVGRLHQGMLESGLRVRCCVAAARDHVAGVPWAYTPHGMEQEGAHSDKGVGPADKCGARADALGTACECFADCDHLPHLRRVAEAIEACSVVCLALSQGAQQSGLCRLQLEMATQMRKTIVPALVQPGYRPHGWVRHLVGGRLIYDLTHAGSLSVRAEAMVATVCAACSAGVVDGSLLMDPVTHAREVWSDSASSCRGSPPGRHAVFDLAGAQAVASCDQQASAVLEAAQLADASMRAGAVGAGAGSASASARMNALVYSRSNSAQEMDARSGQVAVMPPGFERMPTLSRIKVGGGGGGGAGSPRNQMWGMGYDPGADMGQLHPFALPGLPPPPQSPSLYSNQSSLEKRLDRRVSWGVCVNCQQKCLKEAFCSHCGARLDSGSPADSFNMKKRIVGASDASFGMWCLPEKEVSTRAASFTTLGFHGPPRSPIGAEVRSEDRMLKEAIKRLQDQMVALQQGQDGLHRELQQALGPGDRNAGPKSCCIIC